MGEERRYAELDMLRGLAVLLMVAYHFLFNLSYFYGWDIPVQRGIFSLWARGTAFLFLLLVGLCFVISRERSTPKDRFLKPLRRGLILLAGSMVISLATWLVAGEAYVKFGILHLLGVSAFLQPLFAGFKKWNVFLGLAMITLPNLTNLTYPANLVAIPLGSPPPGFVSLDYYPLLPWFGVILIGMAMGSLLYAPSRHPSLTPLSVLPYPLPLLWAGRRALWIYFAHQPVLLALLSLLLGTPTQA